MTRSILYIRLTARVFKLYIRKVLLSAFSVLKKNVTKQGARIRAFILLIIAQIINYNKDKLLVHLKRSLKVFNKMLHVHNEPPLSLPLYPLLIRTVSLHTDLYTW